MKKTFSIILAILLAFQLIPALSFNATLENDYKVNIKVHEGTSWKDDDQNSHKTLIVDFQVQGTSIKGISSSFIAYDNTKLCLVPYENDNYRYDTYSQLTTIISGYKITNQYFYNVKALVQTGSGMGAVTTDEWVSLGNGMSFADVRRVNSIDYVRLAASQSKEVTYSELTTVISIRLAVISSDGTYSTDSIRLLTDSDRTTLGIASSELVTNSEGEQYQYPKTTCTKLLATPTIEYDIARTIYTKDITSDIIAAFKPVVGEPLKFSYTSSDGSYKVEAAWNKGGNDVANNDTTNVAVGDQCFATFIVSPGNENITLSIEGDSGTTLNNKVATFTKLYDAAKGEVGTIDVGSFLEYFKPLYVVTADTALKTATEASFKETNHYSVAATTWEYLTSTPDTWAAATGNTKPVTKYRATFTLTPAENYVFATDKDGGLAVTFKTFTPTISGTPSSSEIKFTCTYDATADSVISAIDIKDVIADLKLTPGKPFVTSYTWKEGEVFTVSSIAWKIVGEGDTETAVGESDKVGYNKKYKAYITLEPKNTEHKFKNDTTKTVVKNNGTAFNESDVAYDSQNKKVVVAYTFADPTAKEEIETYKYTINYKDTTNNKAYHDDSITDVTFTVPAGANYSIGTGNNKTVIECSTDGKPYGDQNKVWTTYNGEKFSFANGNEMYRAKITLVPDKDSTFGITEGDDVKVEYIQINVAEKVVDNINISLISPQVGKKASEVTIIQLAANCKGVEITATECSVGEGTFASKTNYTVTVGFKAKPGYKITTDTTVTQDDIPKGNVTAIEQVSEQTLNGATHKFTTASFQAQDLTPITSTIAITGIVEPKGTETPKTDVTVTSSDYFTKATENAVVWQEKGNQSWDGSKFSYGKTYIVTVTLVATADNCFTSTNKPTINGKEATIALSDNDQTMKASCEFTAPNYEIPEIAGLAIDNDFANYTDLNSKSFTYTAQTKLYDVATKWYDSKQTGEDKYVDNITLKPGVEYNNVKVILTAKEGNQFKAVADYNFSNYTTFTVDKSKSSLSEDKKTLTLIVNVGKTPEATYTFDHAKFVYPYYNAGTGNYADGVPVDQKVTVTADNIWIHDSVKFLNGDVQDKLEFNEKVAEYTIKAQNKLSGSCTNYSVFLMVDGKYDENKNVNISRSAAPVITSVTVDPSTVTSEGGKVTVTVSGTDFTYTDADGNKKQNAKKCYVNVYINGGGIIAGSPFETTFNESDGTFTLKNDYEIKSSTSGINTYEFKAYIDSLAVSSYTATVKQFVGGKIDFKDGGTYTDGEKYDKEVKNINADSAVAKDDKIEFSVDLEANKAIKVNSVKFTYDSNEEDAKFEYNSAKKILTITAPIDVPKDGKFDIKANITYGVIDVESIAISNKTDIMTIGDDHSLVITFTPAEATNQTLTYESTNEDAATIDTDGKIVAKAKGITTIKATSNNGKTDEFKLYVSDKKITKRVSGLSFQGEEVTLNRYTIRKFRVTVSPSDASDQSVTWTTSDPSIAYVDENGYIHALKNGTCTITATSNDGFKTASCEVTVKSFISERAILDFFSAYLDAMESFIDFIVNIGRN